MKNLVGIDKEIRFVRRVQAAKGTTHEQIWEAGRRQQAKNGWLWEENLWPGEKSYPRTGQT